MTGEVSGVDTSALTRAWERWANAPDDDDQLADHLSLATDVGAEIEAVRSVAATELRRHRTAWLPIAAQIAAWLPSARSAQASKGTIDDLKAAASWLADETTTVRNERFQPIAGQVQSTWSTLRYGSNVSLDSVSLEGSEDPPPCRAGGDGRRRAGSGAVGDVAG